MTEVDNARVTQLADTRPQLDTPLRVVIPVNAPLRVATISRDQFVHQNAFSPTAQQISKKFLMKIIKDADISSEVEYDKELTLPRANLAFNMDQDAQIKTSIKDYHVLALSSKRSAKKDEEATAYASLGVIYDNQSNYLQAIEHFKAYLSICEEINDLIGSACACNCIAVDYMLLASPPSDAGCLKGVIKSTEAIDYLNKSLFYHTKHLEIGPDSGGKFVASSNVGICLGMLGDINQSAKYHQDALRIAIKMQTLYGQSIAVGNLGLLAIMKGDYATSKTCFEQHLQLVQTLLDPEAEIAAWKLLANLSSEQENYEESLEHLEEARRIAEKEGLLNELRRIHCLIGVAKGTIEFSELSEQSFS